ncbi:hydrogenase 4 subunit F [Patescibacteria group bacterium]|nr:hydrogenase 4 subunit F [Patescibacteria group bacterium]
MTILALILLSILSGVLPFFARRFETVTALALLGSSGVAALSAVVGMPALLGASALSGGGLWYVDPFGGLLVLLIGFMQWTATMASVPYLGEEVRKGITSLARTKRYFALLALFVLSMLVTVVSNNLGFMWVALEATTLTTTLLVAFYDRKGSVEAAWKYLILCSTGISLGLIGLLMTYYAASSVMAGGATLDWTTLAASAHAFPASIMRIAFAFILIGFGTKAGLVPMHAWLPDAHSSAPSPVSGLLSGVLLNAALFAVLRYKALADLSAGGSGWTNGLLLGFGVLTVAVPAAFIIFQADYKRLLAYSSVEHMGLITFSTGLGVAGPLIAVIHIIGHALTKSMLFIGAGNILHRYESTKFANVGAVMRVLPYTGAFFLAGILLLLAAPLSPLFVSEYFIVSAAVATHPLYTLIILFALSVIFAGFLHLFAPLLFTAPSRGAEALAEKTGERWNISHTAMLLHIVLLLAFGAFLLTGAAYPLLEHVAASIT